MKNLAPNQDCQNSAYAAAPQMNGGPPALPPLQFQSQSVLLPPQYRGPLSYSMSTALVGMVCNACCGTGHHGLQQPPPHAMNSCPVPIPCHVCRSTGTVWRQPPVSLEPRPNMAVPGFSQQPQFRGQVHGQMYPPQLYNGHNPNGHGQSGHPGHCSRPTASGTSPQTSLSFSSSHNLSQGASSSSSTSSTSEETTPRSHKIPRRAPDPATGKSPQIDIHNKPVFDTAEDLKDYFKALAEFLDTNTQSITFGFAIDIQGGKLGTPAGRIYAMTIMAQPVRGGHMLVCTKKARAREDSEAWTNEIRELCKPHVVDLDVLGPSAFDVHGHMRRLTLRYILKSQSIPKIMWNPQNMAATLSKQFMIEMSLPTEDRSDIVAATVSTSTAVAAPPAAATSTDFGETPDSATSGDASEPGEAAASGKAVVSATASDEISASRAASGSAESSGSDEPSSSDETTVFDETPGPDVTYESDATSMSGDISEAFEAVEIFEATEAVEVAEEAEADKADKNSGPTGLDEAAGSGDVAVSDNALGSANVAGPANVDAAAVPSTAPALTQGTALAETHTGNGGGGGGGRGGARHPHVPFSVPRNTVRVQNCLCDLQLLEYKAYGLLCDNHNRRTYHRLLSLSEGVDRYFAKKVSFYNYVVPTVETERNFLRTFSHAMKAIFDARLTQAEPQTLTSAHIKYLIDCVEYLPTMHFIFMDQVNAETERAGSTLNAVAEGTSYRVRTRTAACVNGKPEDELAPESSIAEIFGEGMSHQN